MIYTVTFNPSLDYIVSVRDFQLGKTNRTCTEQMLPGGKGINVAIVLHNLGIDVMALGFTAGFTGGEIRRRIREIGFRYDFIELDNGFSRINVKLKSDQESEINGMGPKITGEDVEALFQKLDRLEKGDVLVLSGSIPAAIDDGIYETIMARLSGRGIRIAVDAEKELLLKVLPYHPFLIKPNHLELGEMFGQVLKSKEAILKCAEKLQQMGAENVLVSMAGDGAILLDAEGQVHTQGVAKGTVKNSVGAGDSMVAGFLAGYLEKEDYGHALKLGTAAGGATAFSDGLGSGEMIRELYETL